MRTRVLLALLVASGSPGLAAADPPTAQREARLRDRIARAGGDVDAQLALAELRLRSGDAEGARHERFVIRTMHRQLRALERAGRACVMPEVETDGRTVVEVIIGPEVPDEDPSVLSEEERRRR